MPRKKTKNYYFDQAVEDAIVYYNKSDNNYMKEKLFNSKIYPALMKLTENIINTFKFMYFDLSFVQLQHDVVSFLVMNLHKYDQEKGSKAFSYFSVVAKNYLILHNNNNYKKLKAKDAIASVQDNIKFSTNNNSKSEYLKDFLLEITYFFEHNISFMFKKDIDIKIAYALLELFKNNEAIENFNKKTIYIYLREMTDAKTTDITRVVNVMKKKYKKLFSEYERTGIIVGKINSFY